MSKSHSFKKTRHNFYERQKLRNNYFFFSLLIAEAILVLISVSALLAHKPFIAETFTMWPLIIFTLLVPTTLLVLYLIIQFECVINDEGIFYKWKPFGSRYKMIQFDAVREMSLQDMSKEPAKWIFSKKYHEVNYLGGGIALFLIMKSGKKRVIGTRKAEEINRILSRLAPNSYKSSSIGQDNDYSD